MSRCDASRRSVQGRLRLRCGRPLLFSPQAMNAANQFCPAMARSPTARSTRWIAGARVDVAPYRARYDRLRAVEAGEAGASLMAVALPASRGGPSGLAHRVLGNGVEAPRRHSTSMAAASIWCFPHPRDELAQSRLRVSRRSHGQYLDAQRFPAGRSDKMSKSEGNFVTIRELRPIGRVRCCGSAC